MRRLLATVGLIATLLLVPGTVSAVTPRHGWPIAANSHPQSQGNSEIKVWVNTHSGVYHCPGTRWYGRTKAGEYMTQGDAEHKGYRPAYGRACQSSGGNSASSKTSKKKGNEASSGHHAGNPNVKVWVNTRSGVYHCPGTRWYGRTKSGEYMTQAQAQDAGDRPAYGKVCH